MTLNPDRPTRYAESRLLYAQFVLGQVIEALPPKHELTARIKALRDEVTVLATILPGADEEGAVREAMKEATP